MDPTYIIEEYADEKGVTPFGRWLLGLKDKRAQARIRARIARASHGNFGDWKKITGISGLCEMREHHGPGYRVYYSLESQKIVLLLAGSTKKDQNKTIAEAKVRLVDYRARSKTDD